jgi:hypothetical protein
MSIPITLALIAVFSLLVAARVTSLRGHSSSIHGKTPEARHALADRRRLSRKLHAHG